MFTQNFIDHPMMQSPDYRDARGFIKRHKIHRHVNLERVIDRLANWDVYIREESYNIYQEQVESGFVEEKQLIYEAKVTCEHVLKILLEQDKLDVRDIDKGVFYIQREMLRRATYHHYMAFQILCSQLSRWIYICCGGSANLMCVIPVRVLWFGEQMLNRTVTAIIRGVAKRQYGEIGSYMPPVLPFDTPNTRLSHFFESRYNLVELKQFCKLIWDQPLPQVVQSPPIFN